VSERFVDHGYDVSLHLVVPPERFHAPGVAPAFPGFDAADAVVVMGAPWSTYDEATIGSWAAAERTELLRADEAGVPVLGICFGGQQLAETHGGSVRRSDRPEVGWFDVATTAPQVVPGGPWFQWHYDSWTAPPGARELARNASASQAFALRRNLAVQFHPELTSTMLAGWIDNGGAAQARGSGLDPDRLLAETRAVDERSRVRAHLLVDGFLRHVATSPG